MFELLKKFEKGTHLYQVFLYLFTFSKKNLFENTFRTELQQYLEMHRKVNNMGKNKQKNSGLGCEFL